jgi:hypothetical protein
MYNFEPNKLLTTVFYFPSAGTEALFSLELYFYICTYLLRVGNGVMSDSINT